MHIQIPQEKPEYTKLWHFNATLDGGMVRVASGKSNSADFNVSFYYEDTLWGQEHEICHFVRINFVEPELLRLGLAELDDNDLLWTKN